MQGKMEVDIKSAFDLSGRMGVPEDIAYGALFLASDASAFMTGQGLIMDGGQLIEGRGFLEYE